METPRGLNDLEELDRVFRALAHETRRHILLVLWYRGEKMTAGQIAERFSCRWPTTTRRLCVLEGAGLVRVVRKGRARIYTLDVARLRAVSGTWLDTFRKGRKP